MLNVLFECVAFNLMLVKVNMGTLHRFNPLYELLLVLDFGHYHFAAPLLLPVLLDLGPILLLLHPLV